MLLKLIPTFLVMTGSARGLELIAKAGTSDSSPGSHGSSTLEPGEVHTKKLDAKAPLNFAKFRVLRPFNVMLAAMFAAPAYVNGDPGATCLQAEASPRYQIIGL